MENKIEIKNAFNETFIILNELNLYHKLPSKLRKMMEEYLDDHYHFSFNKKAPLFNQVYNHTTRNLLTYIYITYINTDENINRFFESEIKDVLENNEA